MPDTATTEKPKRLQCRHIFNDGRRCGAVCLRNEEFCYYHHTTRRRPATASRNGQSTFELPLPEDRSAIQTSIGLILQRIAANDLDPRRAGLLLYGLQIASLNLPRETHDPDRIPAPPIDEIVIHPELGPIAPEAEVPPPHRTSREQLCDWRERDLARREMELNEREARLRQAEPPKPAQPCVHKPIVIPPSCFSRPGEKSAILPDIKAVAEAVLRICPKTRQNLVSGQTACLEAALGQIACLEAEPGQTACLEAPTARSIPALGLRCPRCRGLKARLIGAFWTGSSTVRTSYFPSVGAPRVAAPVAGAPVLTPS